MFGCFFKHKFSKWSEPEIVEMSGRRLRFGIPVTDWEVYTRLEQHRTCARCGEFQRRLIAPDGSIEGE